MSAAALDERGEIAAARPRAGERAVGQGRGLVGEGGRFAARRRGDQRAEPGEPTSSSLLITTS